MSVDKLLYDQGFGLAREAPEKGRLRNDFTYPPFSVWNTREGWWQDRVDRWESLGIQSEVGRGEKLAYKIPMTFGTGVAITSKVNNNGTSVFSPIVCELAYRWWCPADGLVLDPFAGGSVRGIVASVLGCRYTGIELRPEQVEANRAQLTEDNTGDYRPVWVCGDAVQLTPQYPYQCDLLFSCPPYGNLEVYSDDPADISNRTYEQFLVAYRGVVAAAVSKMRQDSFAVWVVANYRDRSTNLMRDLVGDTVEAFEDAGADFYNDIILVNAVGSGAMRARGTFERGSRKMVKGHQNVLVFVRGDPVRAAAKCRPLGPDEES